MSNNTEIFTSRFKSPPPERGPTPSASAPSDGGSFFPESDPPRGVEASFTFPGFDSQHRVPTISPSVGGGSHPSEDSEKKDGKKGSKRTNEEMGKDEEAEDISWSKRPKVKAGRRVKLITITRPKHPVEPEKNDGMSLANTPTNFISMGKTGKRTGRKRGRPKKTVSVTSESPVKKRIRQDGVIDNDKDNIDNNKDKDPENKDKDTETIENEWGEPYEEDEITSLEPDTAEMEGPVTEAQLENEVVLWIIEAQYSIYSLKESTDNEDIKTLLNLFPPKEYQQEGSKKIKIRIFQQVTTWDDNGVMGSQKIIDAINFLRNEKERNIRATSKIEDLIKMFISEVNKKLPKKCEDCNAIYTDRYTNKPTIKCFLCDIGRHGCQEDLADNNRAGWKWVCGECRTLLREDSYIDILKDELSKKQEERNEKITKKKVIN